LCFQAFSIEMLKCRHNVGTFWKRKGPTDSCRAIFSGADETRRRARYIFSIDGKTILDPISSRASFEYEYLAA